MADSRWQDKVNKDKFFDKPIEYTDLKKGDSVIDRFSGKKGKITKLGYNNTVTVDFGDGEIGDRNKEALFKIDGNKLVKQNAENEQYKNTSIKNDRQKFYTKTEKDMNEVKHNEQIAVGSLEELVKTKKASPKPKVKKASGDKTYYTLIYMQGEEAQPYVDRCNENDDENVIKELIDMADTVGEGDDEGYALPTWGGNDTTWTVKASDTEEYVMAYNDNIPYISLNKVVTESVGEPQLLLDSARGIYIPRDFATGFDMDAWHVDPKDAEILAKDPEGEYYYETWNSVLGSAFFEKDGVKYFLYQGESGDLFAAPEGFNFDHLASPKVKTKKAGGGAGVEFNFNIGGENEIFSGIIGKDEISVLSVDNFELSSYEDMKSVGAVDFPVAGEIIDQIPKDIEAVISAEGVEEKPFFIVLYSDKYMYGSGWVRLDAPDTIELPAYVVIGTRNEPEYELNAKILVTIPDEVKDAYNALDNSEEGAAESYEGSSEIIEEPKFDSFASSNVKVKKAMLDYLDFDCAPVDEECVQVSSTENYMPAMMEEAKRFLELLNSKFQKVLIGNMRFKISRNSHDFGTYLSMQLVYNSDSEDETDRAFFIEGNLPLTWSDSAPVDYPTGGGAPSVGSAFASVKSIRFLVKKANDDSDASWDSRELALWAVNDEGLYREVLRMARRALDAARFAIDLKSFFTEIGFDKVNMNNVDWEWVASDLLEYLEDDING